MFRPCAGCLASQANFWRCIIITRKKISLGEPKKILDKMDVEVTLCQLEEYLRYTKGAGDGHVNILLGNARRLIILHKINDYTVEEGARVWKDLKASGHSDTTIRHYLMAYEAMAKSQNIELKVPKPKRVRKPADYLTAPEVRALVQTADNIRDRAIISLLAYCGIRNGELCRLDLDDIDWINRTMIIRKTKNKRPRTVVIRKECIQALEDWVQVRPGIKSRALFLNRYGDRLTKDRLCIIVRGMAKLAGIERRVHPHKMRHTCGTRMIGTGMSVRDTADQLGFESLSMLDIYVHNDSRELREKIDRNFHY